MAVIIAGVVNVGVWWLEERWGLGDEVARMVVEVVAIIVGVGMMLMNNGGKSNGDSGDGGGGRGDGPHKVVVAIW